MEKYFELQYNLSIIGLVILGIVVTFFIIFFAKEAIIYLYKRHSKKYEFDLERGDYVRKKDKHN